jgi:hypothetical protein
VKESSLLDDCHTAVVTPNETARDLRQIPLADLFSLYRGILAELRRRGVVRTDNAPAGDYAEYIVAAAFNGTLAANSEKSYDVLTSNNDRLQVKARVVSIPPKAAQLQLSPFRSFDFDWAVIVLLSDQDYSVWKAAKVPAAVVEAAGVHSKHVNGKVVFAKLKLMNDPSAEEVTETLRAIQKAAITEPALPAEELPTFEANAGRVRFRSGMTVEVGYINPNQQTVVGATGLPGTDHGQSVYVLRCGHCGNEYGSNGSDNHRRRCPSCQGGRPGLPYV